MTLVIVLNCLIAALMFALTYLLWCGRCRLARLVAVLDAFRLGPSQMGYAVVQRRVQLAETRLGLVRLRQRSQQFQQIVRLVKLLRVVMLYRLGQRRRIGRRHPRR
ncbi:MAG: hypothetical protein AAGJ95_07855 [Cyanobacteria bacterium J06554_11]